MKLYRFGSVLGALAFAVVLCNCNIVFLRETENANAVPTATPSSSPLNQHLSKSKTDETLYSLDLDKPEIEQAVELAEADVANAKFVQVEVTHVTNPSNRPASFQVHFQPREGEKLLLGSFSLFPPNNPGKFIVPTQGKVKGKGKLILSLARSDETKAGDVVRMEVKPLKFVNDVDH